MENIDVDVNNITNELLSGKVNDKNYEQIIQKMKTNQSIINPTNTGINTSFIVIWGFMSILGFSYFVYGKKSKKIMPYISGLGMMIIPYFIHNFYPLLWVFIWLIILPFVIKV